MPRLLASALVFVTSGAVLVLEILAGRLLAPYVGVTLETFTAIIGVVLAAMAMGTWIGGMLADRYPPARLLPPCLVLGGASAIASIPVIRALGPGTATATPGTVVVLTTMAFFLPAAILSAASPLVVKIQLDDLAKTGHVVGRLSAIGTAGALFGVFVTGFVLVASFPTSPVVITLGLGLVATGVLLSRYFAPRRAGAGEDRPDPVRTDPASVNPASTHPASTSPASTDPAKRLMAAGVLLALASTGVAVGWSGPCEVETAYFCARVEADPDRPGGRVLWLDTLRHSYVDLDDPTHLEFGYIAIFGDIVAATHGPPAGPTAGSSAVPAPAAPPTSSPDDHGPSVVHIGGGGFTLPRFIDIAYPTSRNVVLELDPELVDLARSDLGLDPSDRMRIRTGDARTGMFTIDDGWADLVFGDAFGGLAVPWHLTTREFTEDVRRSLRPGGVYAINVIDGPPLSFLRAEIATVHAVFDHVVVIAPPERLRGETGGNVVVVASDDPLPADALSEHLRRRDAPEVVLSDPDQLRAFVGDAPVLTDEFAPVDQLLTP